MDNNNNLSKDIINLRNYEKDINEINNKIIEVTNLIDKKCLEIYGFIDN